MEEHEHEHGHGSFATDADTAAYYERRAPEYDEWYAGEGRFAGRDRPGWDAELAELTTLLAGLPAARTLDVACGTGFLTRHLQGLVVGLDQSRAMVAIAQSRLPGGVALVGDALDLPFADGAFDRVVTGHFYHHLDPAERMRFLAEARRVAPVLVCVDSARRVDTDHEDVEEEWQERVLNDGSQHQVFKRWLTGPQLAEEIGGEVLMDGRWFIVAAAGSPG